MYHLKSSKQDNILNNTNNEDIKVCPLPWSYCEISHNNNVYPCCSAYCKGFFYGNIKEQSFDEIWNGEKANFFRNEMLSGNYLLCDLNTCNSPARESIKSIKEKYYDETGKIKYPKSIKLSDTLECNAACITCRDNIINNIGKNEIERNRIMQIIKDIEYLYISGSGDAFGSNYHRNLLKQVAEENKSIKFGICTNGILMTKEMCRDLGILNRIKLVSISLPGATKETYDKIVKFGNFDKVMENLKWISQDNSIDEKIFNFVIHQINYKEIPEFIELGKKYNFNMKFSYYRYWGTAYGTNYDEAAVWQPNNPEHQEFLKILNQDIVRQNKRYFDGTLSKFIQD